jgi:malate dehydrogenase (quinone)
MHKTEVRADVVLIGAGVMSATLGVMLRALQPDWTIQVFERLDDVARESSDAWNNAGTGHSAFCELNYTPEGSDGAIDITKATKIAEQFETSKAFWATLVERGMLPDPGAFIHRVPHMSFVRDEENVGFLHKRVQAMTNHHLFQGMTYSDDPQQLRQWMPLVMEGRSPQDKVAATRMEIGTDVNFGTLTRAMFGSLAQQDGFDLFLSHEIRDVDRGADGDWHITVKDLKSHQRRYVRAPFVFIGAGGGALTLLERTDIPEARGYGGFPVSGQWLICDNEDLVARHAAKVYGKAPVGAPPMSVPHLDTRVIDGRKALLFGPYAGFSTRFLKQGSLLDLAGSITLDNVGPMLSAGLHNLALTRYLLEQITQSKEERLEALQDFVPTARLEDWRLSVAGQRVQVIKRDKEWGGILEFGTEIVNSADGSIAALLGASPGASTSVPIMLDLLARCFPQRLQSDRWQQTLQELVPSFGQSLRDDEALTLSVRERSHRLLELL